MDLGSGMQCGDNCWECYNGWECHNHSGAIGWEHINHSGTIFWLHHGRSPDSTQWFFELRGQWYRLSSTAKWRFQPRQHSAPKWHLNLTTCVDSGALISTYWCHRSFGWLRASAQQVLVSSKRNVATFGPRPQQYRCLWC